MPYRLSRKSNHSQSYRVLFLSGEIITKKRKTMVNARRDCNVRRNCTCKCAGNRSDGLKSAISTSCFTGLFCVNFPTSYVIYEKSKASIEDMKRQYFKFNLFLRPCKKSRLFNSVCSWRLGTAAPGSYIYLFRL